jgi:hypothetical protein
VGAVGQAWRGLRSRHRRFPGHALAPQSLSGQRHISAEAPQARNPKRERGTVKGTEKYWSSAGGEAILRLKGEYLSDDEPMRDFGINVHATLPEPVRTVAANAWTERAASRTEDVTDGVNPKLPG